MKLRRFILVALWADGSELVLTQPTTRRARLERAAASINARWSGHDTADRVELRPVVI